MELIVRLLGKYALWIYILCGLGMIAYLRVALQARREGMYEIFSLEQANAAKRVYRSSAMTLVLLLIVIGVYVLVNYVEWSPTESVVVQTPLPEEAQALTPAPTPSPDTNDPTPTAEPTATRQPRITAIVIPTLVVQQTPTLQVVPASCPSQCPSSRTGAKSDD